MRKKLCQFFSFFLCLTMLLGVIFCTPAISAADASSIYPSTVDGDCGDNTRFYCFPDLSMAVFGTGPIRDYELGANGVSTAPWYSQLNVMASTLFVNKIAIEYGVTEIGNYAFYFPDLKDYSFYRTIAQLYNVDIAYTVTRIGDYAFYNQKMEHITIPGEVKRIGVNAFKKSELQDFIYYGNPNELIWGGMDNSSDDEFPTDKYPSGITCHIIKTYTEEQVDEFKTRFENKNITFVADLDNPYEGIESVDRNIGAYFGSTNSRVFGGAAPFIVVGSFNGVRKSTTYGSAGYVSCVKDSSDNYYVLTNSSTGELNLATVNGISGKMEGYTTAHPDLKLKITPEYVGPDIVKMVYTLENSSDTKITGLKLGGTGDIKIGADDYAALEQLMEDSKQVGIYMRSRNTDYDMVMVDDTPQYATFGFIGKNVKKDQSDDSKGNYPDANFFYGAVGTTTTNSATGTKSMILIPKRIFDPNTDGTALSKTDGDFNRNHESDSGLSYFWDNVEVPAKVGETPGTAQFALMFSVYGVKSNAAADSEDAPDPDVEGASAVTAVTDSKKDEDQFYSVYWMNDTPTYTTDSVTGKIELTSGTVLSKQIVKEDEVPLYSGAVPTKASGPSDVNDYLFSGWSPAPAAGNADRIYVAQFSSIIKKQTLFARHSLTLMGDIGVNFYLNPYEIERAPVGSTVVVEFSWLVKGETKRSSATITVGNSSDRRTVKVGGVDTTYYVASCSVPAAEMAYNIHAKAYFTAASQYHWEQGDYSVREYGMEIINHPDDYDANLVTLAKEMLNYGAKAQIVFDRLDAPLANVSVDGYAMSDVSEELFESAITSANDAESLSKRDMELNNENFGLVYDGSTVSYLSTTTLRHYYKVKDKTLAPTEYTIFNRSLGESGENETKTFGKNNKYLYAEFADIPAAELDVLQKLTVSDGTTAYDYYYSVLDYAELMYLYGDENEQNLGRATYLYNMAANAYFV